MHTLATDAPARPGSTTRILLACGAVAGPLFLVAGLVQAYTRDGFDLKRHPFSLLSLGDLGWIQIASFVVTGLMYVAAAVGMRRVLRTGPGRTVGPLFIGGVGVGLISGGVFLADPAYGFPAGAPAGQPETISLTGQLHGVAFAVGMLSLVAAFAVFARRFAALGQRGWAIGTAVAGVAFLLLAGLGMSGGDFRIVAVAIAVGWGWASAVPAYLMTRTDI